MQVKFTNEMKNALAKVNVPDGFIIEFPKGLIGEDKVGMDIRCNADTLRLMLKNTIADLNVPRCHNTYKGDEVTIIGRNFDGDRTIKWNPNDGEWEITSDG